MDLFFRPQRNISINWKCLRVATSVSGIFVCLLILTLGCTEEPVTSDPVVRPVKVMVIEGETASNIYEYPGRVSPDQESFMAFEVPGRITSFPVIEGQAVKKGQVLAKLDPRDFQADYDAAIARLRQLKAEYQRYAALYESRNTSISELQIKQKQFEVQKATVRRAQKAFNDTKLVAPFSGRVAKKIVKDFKAVQAKEPVLILQDDSVLEVIFNVPERDWVDVKPGLQVKELMAARPPTFSITSISDRTFTAWLKELAATADPETRTFEVTLNFNPPNDVSILPGMTARVFLAPPTKHTNSQRGFVIPSSAVVSDDKGEGYVWLVDPEAMTVQQQPVKTGSFSGNAQIEITEGLSKGNWVATSGVHHLQVGMKVRRLENQKK